MPTITLTGKEIRQLAEYAGYPVDITDYFKNELEELDDCNFTLMDTHNGEPFEMRSDDDDTKIDFYQTIVVCDGCDVSEAYPLGDKVNE